MRAWSWRERLAATLLCLGLALMSGPVQAGVAANATRVIYVEGERERSLMVANSNDYPVIVQTWIDRGEGAPEAVTPFVALPVVFRLAPGALQGVRILHTGEAMPSDRESVYWLNLYEIPPEPPAVPEGAAQVALALHLQLKVFFRPAGLAAQLAPEAVPQALRFRLEAEGDAWFVVCENPTPYHASFTTLAVHAGPQAEALAVAQEMDMMTPPMSSRRYRVERLGPLPEVREVVFGLVGDAGVPAGYVAPLGR